MPEKFRFITEFPLLVPADYDHATRISAFASKYYNRGYGSIPQNGGWEPFNDYLENRDDKFKGATTKLIAGQKLLVQVFRITEGNELAERTECMEFLHSQGALLTGWEGMTLIWEQARQVLTTDDKFVFPALFYSLDEPEALYKTCCKETLRDGVTYSDVYVDACLETFEPKRKPGEKSVCFNYANRSHKLLGCWCYLLCFKLVTE